MKMTDQELKDLVASLAIESKKTDEQIRELKEGQEKLQASQSKTDEGMQKLQASQTKTETELKEVGRYISKLGKLIGNISNSQGAVAEEFFINSIGDTQQVCGIQYDMMYNNLSKKVKDIQDEFDIVLVNGKDIAIIEIKYKLNDNDIDKLLNTKIINFKRLYPEYKDYNHHLGLASFKVYDNVKQKALDNDIFVLQRKGDVIESFLP